MPTSSDIFCSKCSLNIRKEIVAFYYHSLLPCPLLINPHDGNKSQLFSYSVTHIEALFHLLGNTKLKENQHALPAARKSFRKIRFPQEEF